MLVAVDRITDLIPNTPSELGLDVKGDKWRPQQPFAINDAIDTFEGGKQFWLLNGATGAGKSVIAAAIGRALGLRVLFLTHTKQLQQQYLNTMEGAVTATGRNNHECREGGVLGVKQTAEDCPNCVHQGGEESCSYPMQFVRAEDAGEMVLNYAYGCRVLQAPHVRSLHEEGCEQCNPFLGADLLVCDEGDLAERAIIDAVKVEMRKSSFEREGFGLPMASDNLGVWTTWAKEQFDRANQRLTAAAAEYTAGATQEGLGRVRRLKAIVNAVRELAIADPLDSNRLLIRDKEGAQLRPLWGWDDSMPTLFRHFPRVILMSATLGDPAVLTRKMGIGAGQWKYLDLKSPFPVENREVWRWPVARLGNKADESAWRAAIEGTDFIIGKFPGRKGIIHTSSHRLTEMFVGSSRWRDRLIWHTKDGRMEALERFKKERKPLVLVSASFQTGLDLPGLLGFQVIPKIPYASLGDEVTRLRFQWGDDGDRFGKKNYAAETMNTVVQAVGRGVRQESDVCPTFILDGNFNHLVHQAYMPESFKEALRWVEGRG